MGAAKKLGLVGLLAALVATVGTASAASHHGVRVRCSFQMRDTAPYHPKGTYRGGPGSVNCTQPLGKGRYAGKYQDTVVTFPTNAYETGTSKLRLKDGTVLGRYRSSGNFQAEKMHGVMHISGGSGSFRHATGKLRLECTKHVPNAECHGSGILSGI
jgi:hypothetical protein